MAMVKCKECNEDVSTKATACPRCGAKLPEKTSRLTWLVLILVVLFIYTINKSDDNAKADSQSNVSNTSKEVVKESPPPEPSWSTTFSKDEMTGKISAYTHSPRSYPSKKMSFPYHNVYSYMGIGCDGKSEWVYFGFNDAPNLANDETKDGHSLIRTRVKWDKEVENVALTQDWGAKFIHFRDNDSDVISRISASKTALLELKWHGEQPVYFNFTLNGSSKALSEVRAKCAKAN